MIKNTLKIQGALSAPYCIEIRKNFSDLLSLLRGLNKSYKRLCIVTDTNVSPLYLDVVVDALSEKCVNADGGFIISSFIFETGEENKTLLNIKELYKHLVTKGFDRNDALIALGGGVVGDMTGFAAATYQRGIDFIQVPTTLLSMVDSSVGGKTGVDFEGYKNMIGAFHQPSLVYVSIDVLNTLPKEQFSSGMAEVIKHGLIKDSSYVDMLLSEDDSILKLDADIMAELIYCSVRIKAEVVEEDPTEQNVRRLLNFGHTIGHAIEKECEFSLSHGQCVALGCVAAAKISENRGLLKKEDLRLIKRVFSLYELDTAVSALNIYSVYDAILHDKKKRGNSIPFVLLDAIGSAFIAEDLSKDEILCGMMEIFI